jgi:hypothetical protein
MWSSRPPRRHAATPPAATALGSRAHVTDRLVRRFYARQIAQRKELAAQAETFLKTLSAKLGVKDGELKKQLNNKLKAYEQEQKQAAKKVTKPAHLLDRYRVERVVAHR